jgi:hypothetical protein
MKWFKHYSDASRSEKLAQLVDEFGIEGYGRYWLLVELLAEKFDGKDTNFTIHNTTIKRTLYIHHDKMAVKFLGTIANLGLMSCVSTNKLWSISCPKLLEIKDNHTKNLQAKSKSVTPRTDKNRTDKNRENKTSKKIIFDIDLIYSEYPRKQGKAAGIKKLHELIKTQKIYDKILLGSKNYNAYCRDEDTPKQYIKQFSTWVNQECWDDEILSAKQELEKTEAAFNDYYKKEDEKHERLIP